jgi:hypothetical protein
MGIKYNIDEVMKDIRNEQAIEKKIGRPRIGVERRIDFSASVAASTLATFMRHGIKPSQALEAMAKQLRENNIVIPLVISE